MRIGSGERPRRRAARRVLERAGRCRRTRGLALRRRDHGRVDRHARERRCRARRTRRATSRRRRSPVSSVLGQLITPSANAVVPLADWGSLEVLGSTVETRAEAAAVGEGGGHGSARSSSIADHGGLPAGSTIEIGEHLRLGRVGRTGGHPPTGADKPTRRRRPPAPPVRPGRRAARARNVDPRRSARARARRAGGDPPSCRPAATSSRSTARHRSATPSARRAATSPGGWHHGEDIFAPLGTPLLAVADGTVFSVGLERHRRLAALAARPSRERVLLRPPLGLLSARRQRPQVKAGDVLGFMGKTGDAEFSPVHLHFEIHPCRCSRAATTAPSRRTRS